MTANGNQSDAEAGLRFLERDFEQAFQEKRAYGQRAWDVTRFTFTSYSAVLATAAGLYRYSLEKSPDLTLAAWILLLVGAITGLFMFLLTVRNRVYFVVVSRYINEHRAFFLKDSPEGFTNDVGMYTDYGNPPYFSWKSTQSWAALLIAFLNSVAVCALVALSVSSLKGNWLFIFGSGALILLAQVAGSIFYLKSREKDDAQDAVYEPSADRTR